MHIILGVLSAIITILFLLNRLAEAGIDLAGLNPFLWHRRRKWRNMYEGDPIYQISNPMDATAVLMVAVAKADGDLTQESKNFILTTFEQKFNLSKKDAAGLLISSAHLLGDGSQLRQNLKRFVAASKDNFSDSQSESALKLIITAAGAKPHENAQELINQIKPLLKPQEQVHTW